MTSIFIATIGPLDTKLAETYMALRTYYKATVTRSDRNRVETYIHWPYMGSFQDYKATMTRSDTNQAETYTCLSGGALKTTKPQ